MDEPGSDDDGVVLNDTYRMRRTVEKVDIWRAEVESSTICCSCSEPTNSEPRTVPILHSILHSTSSAAAGSVNPPGSSQQSTTPFNPSTSVALQLGGPSGGPPACRLCGLPIDEDVALVRFRERGDQALLRSGASPRSEPSILHTGGVRSWRHYKKPGAGRFKRAIDDPLRPLKRLQNAVSAIDEKSAGKRILRPIKRLFRGSRQSLSSDDGPKPRPRATEMYRAYRADAVPGEGSGAGPSAQSAATPGKGQQPQVKVHPYQRLPLPRAKKQKPAPAAPVETSNPVGDAVGSDVFEGFSEEADRDYVHYRSNGLFGTPL